MKQLYFMSILLTLMISVAISQEAKNDVAKYKNSAAEQNNTLVEEIIVIGDSRGNFTEITENAQKLIDMPGALGDPLSAIYSLPGVVSHSFGTPPAVRGSSPDDNRYIVDFMPAEYIFHEFYQSVFSEYVLQDFQLYSSAYGPQYSDVTGAVFDVSLREPKQEDLSVVLDLNFLRSGFFVESAVTENSAFYLSARKSMVHLIIPEDGESDEGVDIKEPPQDNDYQFKYAWNWNRHHLTFSANGARDYFEATFTPEAEEVRANPDFTGDAKIDNKFHGENVIYTYQNSSSFSLKAGLGRSSLTRLKTWGPEYFQNHKKDATTFKLKASKNLSQHHRTQVGVYYSTIDQGIDYDQIIFNCTEFNPDCDINRLGRFDEKISIDIAEQSAYIVDQWKLGKRARIDLGLHWQSNDYNNESFVHPRLRFDYALTADLDFVVRYGHYNRLAKLKFILPEVGNPELKSPTSRHVSIGMHSQLSASWSYTVDLYYKELENLVLASEGSDADSGVLYSNDVEGRAYGMDLLINKDRIDHWYGWLALNVGKSERTNLLSDVTTDYYMDIPFILNLVLNYQFAERHDLGIRFHVRSGNSYTPIIGTQQHPDFDDAVLPVYGPSFSKRFPIYQRLDIRYKYDFSLWGREASWIIDIINVLNKKNPVGQTLDYLALDYSEEDLLIQDSADTEIVPTFGFRYSW